QAMNRYEHVCYRQHLPWRQTCRMPVHRSLALGHGGDLALHSSQAVDLPEDPICATALSITIRDRVERMGRTKLRSRHLPPRDGNNGAVPRIIAETAELQE
ncbi:MAG: hypothetical protein ACREXT_08705, partial [Gammaproteobacteria bacterium]